MEKTPKSLRLHIAIAGRVNAGKSTLFNLIAGQDAAITSPERGTTTDVVEKAMELRPLGAILLMDTAGTDDSSPLGASRNQRTVKAIDRAEAVILVLSDEIWDDPEEFIAAEAKKRNIPLIPVINSRSLPTNPEFCQRVKKQCQVTPLTVNAADITSRSGFLENLSSALQQLLPEELTALPLLRDLIKPDSLVVLMTPIDLQAPKGRLILPQIQAIRDILDGDSTVVVAKENAFPGIYDRLALPPDLVVCDSQAVKNMISTTPPGIPQTTFSILMARMKGDLNSLAAGCAVINSLHPGDRILIAESCTHHAGSDDIGRVKIPRMLEQKAQGKLQIDFASGADYPANLSDYKLVIHCGGCMLNRKAMLNRQQKALDNHVAITNYGMCISCCSGVLEKVLSPFPDALKSYRNALDKISLRV